VDLRVDADAWLERFDALDAAQTGLAAAAAQAGFRLHVARPVTMRPEYAKGSFSYSSDGAEPHFQPGAALHLLAPLDATTDILATVRRMRVFIERAKLAKNVTVSMRSLALALENPESHRPALLRQISTHVATQVRSLGTEAGGATLTGLDGPLQCGQLDERTIALFLPFAADYATR
jgi:hypothetical protein